MAYLVKYTVEFEERTGEYMTFTRKGEKVVEEGMHLYDESEDEDITVTDEKTAERYVLSLYNDNENNLVDIPEELVEGDNAFEFDSHINIDSVEKV